MLGGHAGPPLPAIAMKEEAVRTHQPALLRRLLELHSPLPAAKQPGGYACTWLAEQALFAMVDVEPAVVTLDEWESFSNANESLPLTTLLATLAKKLATNDYW